MDQMMMIIAIDMQSGSNYGGSDSNSNDNSPQRQPASFRSVAPKTAAPKSMLSRIGDFY